ncbi:hypothetical protein [Alkalihalobacillus sp. AL-G]|uniref:hypothetical protein n=1 Tax=Alkalihalobacillus sp. AL-G TaxID=2926399 RepID=UPI00272BF9DD|nr:hypothetical protein [Alkalihalobacillus sp. AL-G]WLD91602.1 hypothetical protein MOJ78_11140 [Alkalihalobacillus sp. AL-G]
MVRLIYFSIVLCFTFLAGCSVQDKVKLELHINKDSFTLEDKIIVTAKATNTSEEDISYLSNGSCGITLDIRSPYFGRFVEVESNCNDTNATRKTLQSGESIEIKKSYIPKLNMTLFRHEEDTELVPAPSGDYQVAARMGFEMGEPGISVKKSVHIDGGKQLLTIEEIDKAVHEHNKVKDWIENHTGDNVAKEDNGNYYIRENGDWVRVNKDTYKNLPTGIKEPGRFFENGHWKLKYTNQLGDAPYTLEVTVDAYTGEVIEVSTK